MPIDAVAVVVPARNEEVLIAACLSAIAVAQSAVAHLGVSVATVVAADSCVDATARIARRAGAHVVELSAGSVGAARAVGCSVAFQIWDRLPPHRLWLACTDADTVVPPGWLSTQVRAARGGYTAAAGMVSLGGSPTAPASARWAHAYDVDRKSQWLHRRVHGANLGVRGDAYRDVGGFEAVAADEDVRLVRRLQAGGAAVAWPEQPVVVTSPRFDGRAPGGVAADLRGLV